MGKHVFHDEAVVLAGANNWMMTYGSVPEDGPVGHVSHWKVDYSPYGAGSALFLGTGTDRRIISDNIAMAAWISKNLLPADSPYADDGIDIESGSFSERNDVPHSYGIEAVTATGTVRASWSELSSPVWGYTEAEGSDQYTHSATYVPAMQVEVRVDDAVLDGVAVAEDWFGRASSSCFLALTEVWKRAPGAALAD